MLLLGVTIPAWHGRASWKHPWWHGHPSKAAQVPGPRALQEGILRHRGSVQVTASRRRGSDSSPLSTSRGSGEGSPCCRTVQVPTSLICHSLVPVLLLTSPCCVFLCRLVPLLLLV